jgi:hypothetical protein
VSRHWKTLNPILTVYTLQCLFKYVFSPLITGLKADGQQFETLGGFKQFSEVLAVGLTSSREALKKWRAEGRLPSGLVDDVKGARAIKRANRLR